MVLFNALLHPLNIAIKSRQKSVIYRHQKKLFALQTKQKQHVSAVNHIRDEYMKGIVHNYSSYALSKDEEIALSYGLENHIPTKTSHIAINTEFEQFYQRLLHYISHIPEEDLAHIETKLRNTCEKYSKIKVPYKYRKIVETLSKNCHHEAR